MARPGDVSAQTDYTAITTIVVTAANRQAAENAAQAADPEAGAGAFDPGVPLRQAGDPTNTITHYWARWNMLPSQRAAFASNLGGANIIRPGGPVQPNRDAYLFDSAEPDGWTDVQVLGVLGLDRLAPEPV